MEYFEDDIYDYESEFEEPTVEFLQSQYDFVTNKLKISSQTALTKLAEMISQYFGFNDDCFVFFDKHNFDYNTKGRYKGDAINSSLIEHSCEYRDFDLLKNLHKRGATINNDLLYVLILGHGSGWHKRDYSQQLQYLIDHGAQFNKDINEHLYDFESSSISDLDINVQNVINKHITVTENKGIKV